MLKVVVHSYFDMFTYKAMGAAFVISYAVLLSFFPEFDMVGNSLIAILVGILCWLMLSYLGTRMNGLCIEFRYSKSRPGLSVMTLWLGLRKLGHVQINMSLDNLGKPKVNQIQVIAKLNYFFERYLNALASAQVVHFVGCQKDDVDKVCKVISLLTSVKG